MPHAFKPHPKHPAVDYLVRLHADIGGRIKANREEANRLADDMRHVEAVLKMFDPTFCVRAIAARRRRQGNPWFKRGTLFRQALEVLRGAAEPMTAKEITAAVLASKGIMDATDKQHAGLQAGIRTSLEDHAGKTVERVGDGVPRRWRLLTGQ
ncbi:MAG TPA: hypothetical protein VKT99_18055 [Xanthobacteraceae bacterium]|jgi:hypothetical protein|nr:hypothetical protein [Xanthobacteraceae bacterium]